MDKKNSTEPKTPIKTRNYVGSNEELRFYESA